MSYTVYYNFNTLNMNLTKGNITNGDGQVILSKNKQPNIQFNDVNYFAYSVYLNGTGGAPHLIVKCYADPDDLSTAFIYFAIPLVSGDSSDVDKIIAASNVDGGNVTLDLQPYIKHGNDKGLIGKNGNIVTIVAKDSSIPCSTSISLTSDNINNINLTGLSMPGDGSQTVNLIQQSLDWVMSCDLLDENGEAYPNPTMDDAAKQTDTSNTITFLMMAMMIAGAAYLIGPTVYNVCGINNIAKVIGMSDDGSSTPNHYSINIFWGFILVMSAMFCLIQGSLIKNNVFYFLSIGFVLAYFAATSAILKLDGVANKAGNGFANMTSMFAYFSAILVPKTALEANGLSSIMHFSSAFLCGSGILAGFILMIVGLSIPDQRPLFSVGISLFLILPAVSMLLVGAFLPKK